VKGLIWIEGNVNDKILPKLPRELILSLESKEFPGKNVFITITKKLVWQLRLDSHEKIL